MPKKEKKLRDESNRLRELADKYAKEVYKTQLKAEGEYFSPDYSYNGRLKELAENRLYETLELILHDKYKLELKSYDSILIRMIKDNVDDTQIFKMEREADKMKNEINILYMNHKDDMVIVKMLETLFYQWTN
jgi:hypothetical protein